jgi:hypothetical protein
LVNIRLMVIQNKKEEEEKLDALFIYDYMIAFDLETINVLLPINSPSETASK